MNTPSTLRLSRSHREARAKQQREQVFDYVFRVHDLRKVRHLTDVIRPLGAGLVGGQTFQMEPGDFGKCSVLVRLRIIGPVGIDATRVTQISQAKVLRHMAAKTAFRAMNDNALELSKA